MSTSSEAPLPPPQTGGAALTTVVEDMISLSRSYSPPANKQQDQDQEQQTSPRRLGIPPQITFDNESTPVWSIRDIPVSEIGNACATTNREVVTIGLDNDEERELWACAKEEDRLKAVLEYDVLDVPPEPAFERLTALGCRVFDAPVCFVSILDIGRQYFLSSQGIHNLKDANRKDAFW
jgi:hypothetical protein